MVRGNWQKRVEQAKERKKSNKQNKAGKNQLLSLLNGHNEVIAFLFSPNEAKHCCKSYFFRGDCRHRKCRLSHDLSLIDCLKKQNYNQITACEEAESLQLIDLSLVSIRLDHDDATMSSILNKYDSMVYIVADGSLVFDRHQGGSLSSSKEKISVETKNISTPSKTVKEIDAFCNSLIYTIPQGSLSGDLATNLPATVLESIILLLPDYYAGLFPQVCKSWNEVALTSTSLWRVLIQQRDWPYPNISKSSKYNSSEVDELDHDKVWRRYFVRNYDAMKNITAFQKGMQTLTDPRRRDSTFHFKSYGKDREVPMAMQIFKSTSGSPSPNNNWCISMKAFDSNSNDPYFQSTNEMNNCIISAYHTDGTLRVFEPIADHRGNRILCRQTASVRSIFLSKGLELIEMEAEETFILCISSCMYDSKDISFNVLLREEVLCSAGGVNENGSIDSKHFKSFNASSLVKKFVQDTTSAEVESAMFVTGVGHQSLLSCGNGKFFLTLFVSVDVDGKMKNQRARSVAQEEEKLCIFDAAKGLILFLSSKPSPVHSFKSTASEEDNSCSIIRKKNTNNFAIFNAALESYVDDENREQFFFSISSLRCTIDGDNFESTTLDVFETELTESWSVLKRFKSGFACIISGQNQEKTLKLFWFANPSYEYEIDGYESFDLTVEGTILGIDQINNTHLVIMAETALDYDGSWFEEDGVSYDGPCNTHAIIFNLETHQVIEKLYCGTRDAVERGFSFSYVGDGDFLACEINCEAVLITGHNVAKLYFRSQPVVLDDQKLSQVSMSSSEKKKKKKKRLASKTGKKDGFARGMSLRG